MNKGYIEEALERKDINDFLDKIAIHWLIDDFKPWASFIKVRFNLKPTVSHEVLARYLGFNSLNAFYAKLDEEV